MSMLVDNTCTRIATRTGHHAAGTSPSATSTPRSCRTPRRRTTRPTISVTCLPTNSWEDGASYSLLRMSVGRTKNDIEKTETLWLYGAAATRSDLPGVETGIMCHSAVGHETNSDKTIDVEFRKDSGRVGSLRSFENDFQNSVDFPSPTSGMVGLQKNHGD